MEDEEHYKRGFEVGYTASTALRSIPEAVSMIKASPYCSTPDDRYHFITEVIRIGCGLWNKYSDAVALLVGLELNDCDSLMEYVIRNRCKDFILEALLRAYSYDIEEIMKTAVRYRNDNAIRLLNNRDEV